MDIISVQSLHEREKTDEYVDAADDCAVVQRMMNFPSTHGAGDAISKQVKAFKPYLKYISEASLKDSEFLASSSVTIADYSWFHIVETHQHLCPDILDKHQTVVDWLNRVKDVEGVGEYLNSRPPLSDLGESSLKKQAK